MNKIRRSCILAVFSALLLAGAGVSRPPRQDVPQPKLQYDVRVALKLVQVSVLDKNGNPVTDLAREDFELTDNGKAIAFDQFEKKVMGLPSDLSGQPAFGPGINRRYFLIFDFSLSGVRGIQKAKQAGLRFLDEVLQPSDEVAMVSFVMPRGLRVHEYLTTDHARIRKDIENLGTASVAGRAENLARYWVNHVDKLALKGDGAAALEDYEYAAQYMDFSVLNKDKKADALNQGLQFSRQLRTLAKSLRYVPGAKNVVLFSDGIPRQVLYGSRSRSAQTMSEWTTADQLAAQQSAYSETQIPRQNVLTSYQKMMEEFKTSNCPVYAFDIGDARGGPDISEAEGSEAGGSIASFGSETLREISSTTGGRFLGNTSDISKAVQSLKNITGAIYVLGYPVQASWDGKYHKIKVKVRRKGCDVVAQAGYYNPKPYKDYSTDDKLFQLLDLALSDNPQYMSGGGDLPFAAFPVWEGGWSYAAGIARLAGDRTAELLGKNAETFLLILNEQNDILAITGINFGGLAPSKGALDGRFVMPMKPGKYRLRLVTRNIVSGWGARGTSALIIPDASASAVWIDPPLLLRPATDIVPAEAPGLMTMGSLYPYDSSSYAPALGPVPAVTPKLFSVLRCSGALGNADVAVSAALTVQGGLPSEVPVTVVKQTKNGGTQILFVEFPVAGLASGTYTLSFTVKESSGFLSGNTAVTFRIE
jgi:VWFA-related protein